MREPGAAVCWRLPVALSGRAASGWTPSVAAATWFDAHNTLKDQCWSLSHLMQSAGATAKSFPARSVVFYDFRARALTICGILWYLDTILGTFGESACCKTTRLAS